MTSRGGNLAGLFSTDTPDQSFTQGVIVAWDSATGTNAVEVKGTVLTDLPCLNIGDFVVLSPGDVVGIQRVGSTYYILGRIQLPSVPDESRAVLDFNIQDASDDDFGMNTTYTTRLTITIPLPTWIREDDEIAIGATFVCSARNSLAGTQRLLTTVIFDYGGVSVASPPKFRDVPTTQFGQCANVGSLNIPGWSTVATDGSVVVRAQAACTGGAWGTDAANGCAMLTQAMFRRTQ